MKNLLGEEVYTRLFADREKQKTAKSEKKNNSTNACEMKFSHLITDNIQLGRDKLKNTKLVNVLKQKMFKGYMKIKAINDYRKRPKSRPISSISVNGKRFKVKKKKKKELLEELLEKDQNEMNNYLKIEKCSKGNTLEERKNNKMFQTTLYKNFFVTERPEKYLKEKEDEKEILLLNQIYNKNFEEAEQYNKVTFLALDVKKPQFKTHYATNKAKIEKEILREIESINRVAGNTGFNTANNSQLNLLPNFNNTQTDQMGRTSRSEFLYKISRLNKDKSKEKNINYMNFHKNPGLAKGFSKLNSTRPSGKATFRTTENSAGNDKPTIEINTTRENKPTKSIPISGNVSLHQSNSQSNIITSPFSEQIEKSSKYGKTQFASKTKMHKMPLQENDNHIIRMESLATNFEQLKKTSPAMSQNNLIYSEGTSTSRPVKFVNNLREQFEVNHNLFQELASIPDIQIESSQRDERKNSDPNFVNTNDSFFSNKITKTKNYQYEEPIRSPQNHVISSFEKKNFNKVRNNIITNRKDKFKVLKEMAFEKRVNGDRMLTSEGGRNRSDSDNRIKLNSFYNPNQRLYEKEKLTARDQQNKQSRSRDYKISKHLYKIYDKEEVDIVIYGSDKFNKYLSKK